MVDQSDMIVLGWRRLIAGDVGHFWQKRKHHSRWLSACGMIASPLAISDDPGRGRCSDCVAALILMESFGHLAEQS